MAMTTALKAYSHQVESFSLMHKFAMLAAASNWTEKAIQQLALACLNDLSESRSCERINAARIVYPNVWRRVYTAMRPFLNNGLVIKGKAVNFIGNYAELRQVVADLRTYVRENGSFPELPKVKRTTRSAYDRIASAIRQNANADKRIGILLDAINLIESGELHF